MGFDLGNIVTKIPIIGSALDPSQQQGMDQLQNNQNLYNGIKTPDLTWKDYNPEQYDPTMASAQQVTEDPGVIDQQMSALNSMSGLAKTGMSDQDAAAFQEARNQAGQIEHQGEGAALDNAQSRGVSGSGMEYAMREMANQNAANSAQTADLSQAATAAQQRALYNQAYGQQVAGVRGQNYNTQANNTNILNQFNAMNTQAKNAAAQYNVGNANAAQQYNNQGQQATQQQNFNNQITKAGGQAQANSGMASGYGAINAANQSAQNGLMSGGFGMGQAIIGAAKKSPAGDAGARFGGIVPGLPKVRGNSFANDTVPINAAPGEIIVPRSHSTSPNLAKLYIDHIMGVHNLEGAS